MATSNMYGRGRQEAMTYVLGYLQPIITYLQDFFTLVGTKPKRYSGVATQSTPITLQGSTPVAVTKSGTAITSCFISAVVVNEVTTLTANTQLLVMDNTTELMRFDLNVTADTVVQTVFPIGFIPLEVSTALKMKLTAASDQDIDVSVMYTAKT